MSSADLGKLRALRRLTSLAFERDAMEVSRLEKRVADLRAEFRRLGATAAFDQEAPVLQGRLAERHQIWLERRRMEVNQDLANTLADLSQSRQKARLSFGRDQIAGKLSDRAKADLLAVEKRRGRKRG